jgi:hypothetical protein
LQDCYRSQDRVFQISWAEPSEEAGKSSIINTNRFNGYTNHWQNYYYEWHRYGNLFKIALPETELAILQSKIDIAEDMGMPGLLMQEVLSPLCSGNHTGLLRIRPWKNWRAWSGRKETILVITDPSGSAGRRLEEKAADIFRWAEKMNSYQLDDVDLELVKAFCLTRGNSHLFVISPDQGKRYSNSSP